MVSVKLCRYFYITGSIELEKMKTENMKKEHDATMQELLDIAEPSETIPPAPAAEEAGDEE